MELHKAFHGLAIGGPLDGEKIVSYSGPFYKAAHRYPMRPISSMRPEALIAEDIKTFTYEHDFIDCGDDLPFYVWRLSTDTMRDVIYQLLLAYPRGKTVIQGGEPR